MTSCLALMTFWLTAHGGLAHTFRFRCAWQPVHMPLVQALQCHGTWMRCCWPVVSAGIVCFVLTAAASMAGCTLRRYYVQGENSPAVPLAFMAAHTVCSLGEEAAHNCTKAFRGCLIASAHTPMRPPDTARRDASTQLHDSAKASTIRNAAH